MKMSEIENTNIGHQEISPEPDKETKQEKPKKKEKEQPGFIQTTLRKIGFAALFLLIGGLAVALGLYLPARSELKSANAELERLTPIEADYTALVAEYETVFAEAQIYKLLSNGFLLETAISGNDSARVRQLVGYIEDDLAEMDLPGNPDVPASLADQFKKVTANTGSNPVKAASELNNFLEDLRLLLENIE